MRYVLILSLFEIFLFQACKLDELSDVANVKTTFPQQLSEYNIYVGNPSDLIPSPDYKVYLLGSTLFTDFADKQRLIKLPIGTLMSKIDDGLPMFPDGTVIVKTFFYYHDKRDLSKGKRVIETRLLVKEDGKWNVADYLWNESQTDATFIEDGLNTTVNYIDEDGEPKVLAYHVPNNRECATCHLKNDDLSPLGPKLRNLNITAESSQNPMNQLAYFQKEAMLNQFDHTTVSTTPNFENINLSTEIRARAYLDANCGHCHNIDGFAADTDLFLDYDVSLENSNIRARKEDILDNLNEGKMPFLGTSVLDQEGIELIKDYLDTL